VTNLTASSSIPTPDIGIDFQGEEYLKIIAPVGWNSFKANDLISLEIRNISDNQITSGPDFGIRVFIRLDKKWVEVKNNAIYQNYPYTLEPGKGYESSAATMVMPDLPDYSTAYDVRIIVVGNLVENGKDTKKVASFIDLKLTP